MCIFYEPRCFQQLNCYDLFALKPPIPHCSGEAGGLDNHEVEDEAMAPQPPRVFVAHRRGASSHGLGKDAV